MAVSIDRQTIVDELLSGLGNVLYLTDWMGHESKSDPPWVHEYDPEAAKRLLADAGYPNGFSITLTPAIRGAPAEVEACEAVARYWEEIGIDVKLQNVPYATFRSRAPGPDKDHRKRPGSDAGAFFSLHLPPLLHLNAVFPIYF